MSEWIEREVSISEIATLLEEHEIEISSPDGWVGVNFFIDKGMWEEYVLTTEDGKSVKCNQDHLFKDLYGEWISAENLLLFQEAFEYSPFIMTINGPKRCSIEKTGQHIPIVDINVNHENHRYYTNGIESHNTGVGKSLFMCHCAAGNLTNGHNVLYITLEMAEEKIAQRIDANLLDIPLDQLAELPKAVYEKKIAKIKETAKGRLIIKEYPTSQAGSANFRHLLNELRIKKNFVPDVVYIDYINICSSSRIKNIGNNVNSYTYVKAIAEELRGLAVEFNVALFTATQTTRTGYSSSDVELTDTSESFGLPATADFMFALIATEELDKLSQIMIKQLKNRYDDPSKHRRFVVGVDRSRMRLYDVEESAQADLMKDQPSQKPDDRKSKFASFK